MRICSLLPSATEIVFALGLGDQLVGRSHTCDYPEEALKLPVLTQSLRGQGAQSKSVSVHGVSAAGVTASPSYALDVPLLRELHPDLILTQDICDVCAIGSQTVFEVAAKALGYAPEFVTIQSAGLEDVWESMLVVGRASGVEGHARGYVAGLRARVEAVRAATQGIASPRRVLCVEWAQTLWISGLWIPEMVAIAGGTHGITRAKERSRKVSWEEVMAFVPEVLMFMPCGWDLPRSRSELTCLTKQPQWGTLPAVRAGEVYLFDGRVPSRYGPRTVDVLEAFGEILHPDRFMPRWEGVLYERAT